MFPAKRSPRKGLLALLLAGALPLAIIPAPAAAQGLSPPAHHSGSPPRLAPAPPSSGSDKEIARRQPVAARDLDTAWRRIRRLFPSPADRTLIAIDIQRQRLYLLARGRIARRWPVSTSVYGIGERAGSEETPIGVFRVARKIGAGLPPGEILRSRRPIGRVAVPSEAPGDLRASTWVTTRILWLSGLQPGWNEGGKVDTFRRYVYIHGTANIGMLGRPASHGCVQMAPRAVIALFRRVRIGTPVLIVPDSGHWASIPGLANRG